MRFSIIIPVFNRPTEIQELLESLAYQDFKDFFEIVIIEDGSTITCKNVIYEFIEKLNISYYFKENSGPGDSRNFGMHQATGDYFIIFDSDCVLPTSYLSIVDKNLKNKFIDCYGGPDAAQSSFSKIQKAINYSMTSLLTTGGIRGGNQNLTKFEPRSFNMGLSREAFLASGGFGQIHPGEDPDLSIRLWKLGYETALFSDAFVFHKRRIDWKKFYVQVNKFGKARPILNSWHPEYAKMTYFFPTLFILGFTFSLILLLFKLPIFLYLYLLYFTIILIHSALQNKSLIIGFLSVQAVLIQFFGYGWGFLISYLKVQIFKLNPEEEFPELFFK